MSTFDEILLSIIAAGLGWAALELYRIRRLLKPNPNERVKQVQEHANTIGELVSSDEGKQAVEHFFVSEVALRAQLDELEKNISEMPEETIKGKASKKLTALYKAAKAWLSANKGKITEILFKKLNEMIKGFIPGGKAGPPKP